MTHTDLDAINAELADATSLLDSAPTADDCSDAIETILTDAAMWDGDNTALRALLASF